MDVVSGKVKSLKIVRTPYIQLLRQDLPHRNYFESFLCSQTPEIHKDGPSKSDIKLSKSNLKFHLPFPISEPKAKAIIEDPCFELIRKKQTFLSKVESAKKKYQYDNYWFTKDKILNNEVKFVPEYIYELTNGKYADVDPYFNSSYDFYYTGGNICKIREGDDAAVIYSDNFGNLSCTNIKTAQTTPLLNLNDENIYNIKSYLNNYLLVRQKHEINVVRVKLKHDNYSAKPLWNINNPNVPLSDCDLLGKSEICYTDMTLNLKILDMKQEKCKYEHKFTKKDDDGLFQVKYLNENVLSIMTRDYLSIFDQRSSTYNNYLSEELFFKCNHYCAFCVSKCSDNYLYIGTKHNVLKFDLRKMAVVKKWTHFMNLDPNVIKVGKYNGGEVVCVSSFVDSVCFPTGSANYMPLQLMNTKVAFDECILKKEFIFREDLEKRLGMGIVGMEFLERKSDFAVFTCNSIGDVFQHNLKINSKSNGANDMFTPWMQSYTDAENSDVSQNSTISGITDDKNMATFISWLNSVPEIARPLNVTSVKNMRDAKKFLMKNRIEKTENAERNIEDEPDFKSLMQHLDDYAEHNFANIWSSGGPVNIGSNLNTVSAQSKVSEWLQSTLHADTIIKEDN